MASAGMTTPNVVFANDVLGVLVSLATMIQRIMLGKTALTECRTHIGRLNLTAARHLFWETIRQDAQIRTFMKYVTNMIYVIRHATIKKPPVTAHLEML
jgi:hypothetical protein